MDGNLENLKEYKIKTIQDIVNCTNSENLDRFLLDLKLIILNAHLVNSVSGPISLIDSSYNWIDDNKHDITINLLTNKTKQPC